MTEKSNDLSDKDKVTQASKSEEVKGIEKETNSEPSDEVVSDQTSEPESEVEHALEETAEVVSEDVKDSVKTEEASEEPVEESTATEAAEVENESPEIAEATAEEIITPTESVAEEVVSEKESDEKPASNKVDESEVSEDEDTEEGSEEENHDEHDDITSLSKIELVALLKSKVKQDNIYRIDKLVHEIKAAFDEFTHKEKDEALEKFKADGGADDDFDFRPSDEEKEFNTYYFEYRQQLGALRKEAEKQKETNLTAKTELLNKLRDLVDGEETTLSMATIKALQEEWKSIGPVPPSQNRSLWASYNALMDRFYDNRSIYFELKELDRKKNLESKLELVDKAEALKDVKDLKDAIKALNDLHEEFKHIGPVPRDEQEGLWQKFKGASDAVYDRRKDFYESQKEVYKVNHDQKEVLIEALKPFAEFKADRIREWNIKTKEILEIQKRWEKIGPVPRESGKDINKSFWASFKQFFHNKNLFFKELDEIRATNQAKAEELIVKAEELKDNTDWQNTANALVKLQQD